MPAQCRRFFGSIGHSGPAAVVPAEKLIPRAGEAGIVVGVRVGEDQQKPLLLPRPAQKPVHCPQGKAVPVPPGGSELENPVVALIFPVVPVLPQHRTAADGTVGQHPDRNCAPGQRFGQNVALRRQLLLPPVLGGGGVQQNVHDQIPKGIGLLPVKHPAVPQGGGAPCKRRVDPSRAAPKAPVLLKQQNGVLQLLGKALNFQPVLGKMRLKISAVALRLLLKLLPFPGGRFPVFRRFSFGEVQNAVAVMAGAAGSLRVRQFRRGQHGFAEARGGVLPQIILPGLPPAENAPRQSAQPHAALRRGLPQTVQPAGAEYQLGKKAQIHPAGAKVIHFAAQIPPEIFVQNPLHPGLYGLGIPVGVKFQRVQNLLFPAGFLTGQTQRPAEPADFQPVLLAVRGGFLL